MRLSASRIARIDPAGPRTDDQPAGDIAGRQRHGGDDNQHRAHRVALQVEAQQLLEVGEAVVAAKAHVVAEEREHQGVAEGLGDDRQIDAGDARSERQPSEHQREQPGHHHHHGHRPPEMAEPGPEPGQLRPVQEHHEIRQQRIAIHPAGADLTHQIHAHRVAAEREERRMAEAENAAEPPDEVDRQRQHRVAHVLADQGHHVGRHVERRRGRHQQVEDRHQQCRDEQEGHERQPGAVVVERGSDATDD